MPRIQLLDYLILNAKLLINNEKLDSKEIPKHCVSDNTKQSYTKVAFVLEMSIEKTMNRLPTLIPKVIYSGLRTKVSHQIRTDTRGQVQ